MCSHTRRRFLYTTTTFSYQVFSCMYSRVPGCHDMPGHLRQSGATVVQRTATGMANAIQNFITTITRALRDCRVPNYMIWVCHSTSYSGFPIFISKTPITGFAFSSSRIAGKLSSVTTVYSGHIFPSRVFVSQCILNSWIVSPLLSGDLCLAMNSAQLGEEETTDEICLLSDFRVILDDVSRSRNSWRLLGGSVKRRGRDMFVVLVVVWSVLGSLTLGFGPIYSQSAEGLVQ
jgi:hypothetical protein